MHELTGQKQTVLDSLQKTIDAFKQDSTQVQQIMKAQLQPANEVERQAMRAQILVELQKALDTEKALPHAQPWYAPQNSVIALVQSAMDAHLNTAPAGSAAAKLASGATVAAEIPFSTADPGWIEVALDTVVTAFRGKAKFVTHKNLTDFVTAIPDQCSIALLADWGADDDAARNVAAQVRAQNPDYVIHLGDIYYAGQGNECDSFLQIWPGNLARSFALSGNHEMYSGGHDYFGKVLPRFKQPASYFGLRNQNWQFLGIDTAYVDHQLTSQDSDGPALHQQFIWIVDKLMDTTRNTVLLSHHQPFSAFQPEHNDASRLRDDLAKLYEAAGANRSGIIYGWFFGHEHKCTIYNDNFTDFRARLIGHGCIPHSIPDLPANPPVRFTSMNRTPKPGAPDFAISGFALLELNGPAMNISYINEDGSVFTRETWTKQAAAAAAPGS